MWVWGGGIDVGMRQAQGFREGSTDSGARVFKIGETVYRLRA